MSNIIDKTDLMKAFRLTISAAQVVNDIVTGESYAIRTGVYDPLLHIQTLPETRILDVTTDLAVVERTFDPDNKSFWVRETLLPAGEQSSANGVNMLSGIMNYTVFVPSKDGGITDLATMNAKTKYLQEIFSPELDPLSFSFATTFGYEGIAIDAVSLVSTPKEEEWVSSSIDITFRAYRR